MNFVRATRYLALSATGVVLGLVAPATAGTHAAPATASATPVTSGPHYDRNGVAVVDRNTTWLLFARSQQDCNRLQGCDADNSNYDLYAMQSADRGRTWSAPELVATNPSVTGQAPFRGRTIAVTETEPGTFYVVWTSGGNTGPLYWLSHTAAGGWSPLNRHDGPYFNATVVTLGKTVFVYSENGTSGGIDEQVFDPATGTFSDATQIGTGAIPKAIVDKHHVVRMTTVDPATGTVNVASSSDGWTWSAWDTVAAPHDDITNWDPSLVQIADGTFELLYAPSGPVNQNIAARVSHDFQNWSDEITLTSPDGWWDYWPTAIASKSGALGFETSEAPLGDNAAGTGHIWAASVKP